MKEEKRSHLRRQMINELKTHCTSKAQNQKLFLRQWNQLLTHKLLDRTQVEFLSFRALNWEPEIPFSEDFFYPRILSSHQIDFYRKPDLWDQHSFGMLEPRGGEKWLSSPLVESSKKIKSLCLVPGVLFDLEGGRMGYGRGYYDRFLASYSGYKLGVCWSFQVSDSPLDLQSHDEKMNGLLTELYFLDLGNEKK